MLLFELPYLSNHSSSQDTVVGWGAFPLVDGDFTINQGKFKVPMIFGQIDYSVDSFKHIEEKYRRNVDEWLANLYIEVHKRDMIDFKEYESAIVFNTRKEEAKKKRTKRAW